MTQPRYSRRKLLGKRFGRLVVIDYDEKIRICRCDCGKIHHVHVANLKATQSCGCYAREQATKHGQHNSPEYRTWIGMKGRCHNPNHPSFKHYGARGLAVCTEWRNSFETFIQDVGPRPSPKHSVDRVDNQKGYVPGNVRWATQREQMNNTRSNVKIEIDNETRTISQWARKSGVNRSLIVQRLHYGWSARQAVWTPPNPAGKKHGIGIAP